ncbi:MAG: pantoate--beta-alanine ligase [Candidatus Methylacidiphilales bacterium]|nr:pantoate--beta-alanine ligase [Candidatus Methylacidiphilales bacterium]
MHVIDSPQEMHALSQEWRRAGHTIGLVPTMGALHAGHLELIRRARAISGRIIVSIYVNPTQFAPAEDLSRYPRPRRTDMALCLTVGVDAVFAPMELYETGHSTWVTEHQVSKGRCATSRPDHFRGVATVVMKLFNLTQPDAAWFGQKDAQQLDVIRRMVRDLNVPVRIHPVETVRDRDGLALSSRNVYLSDEERTTALALPRGLADAVGKENPVGWLREKLSNTPGIELDYVEAAEGRLCAAVRVGKTRLIDNVPLPR